MVLLDDDVPDLRRCHRLDTLLAQRLLHRLRDQVAGHVVQDLVAESRSDHPDGHLARPEPRQLGPAAVIARQAIEFGVHHLAG
jgi:hypothetical protein